MPRGENLNQPEPAGKQRSQAKAAAALAIALGRTVREAAAEAKVSERCIYNWRRQRAFAARVEEIRSQLVGEAVGRLSTSMGAAADVLAKLLKSRSEATRLKASTALLQLGRQLRETDELARQLSELERRLDEAEGESR